MRCDLIIPAVDEVANIDPLFDALEPLRGGVLRHVVLADNGSTDGTPEAAARRGAVVVREPKRGYGAACLKALKWIGDLDEPPEIVAFLDADLSDDPGALPAVLAPIEQGRAELVIGSRVKRAEPGALNFVQRFGNGLACLLIQVTTGRRYHDLGPLRAVRFDTLQRLQMADRTWGWTVEMQVKAALAGVPTVEVDVPYRRRVRGRSKISGTVRGVVAAGTRIIYTIIALWWRHRRKSQA
ncbi:MAG: glycosyltransferase family 2 protein [Planctomycetes bacterium]|nr:glycosyltransferase family 2 protein [Planctomycetota bacterium]